ncbi:unnamed protein product [Arabidopsis halleri]
MTLYALPLVGLDMVLGVQWLSSLGPMVCDWKEQTMEFDWEGTGHKLVGLQTMLRAAGPNEVEKEARQGQAIFAIQVSPMEEKELDIPDDMKPLVQDYGDLFQPPVKLPPSRAIEHRIPLKKGTDPVNVRPYRYAYFQKDEIEKQDQDSGNAVLACSDNYHRTARIPWVDRVLPQIRQRLWIDCETLTNLLRKGAFTWVEDAEAAFNSLKTALTSTPTLALPDFTIPFVIQTDASGDEIGAVFHTDLETVLVGDAFHYSNRPEQPTLLIGTTHSYARAAEVDGEITGNPVLNAVFVQHTTLWDEIRSATTGDKYMQRLSKLADSDTKGPYNRRNNLVCYKNRLVVPPSSHLVPQLLKEHHDTPMGGHSGVLRTYKRLARHFYWPSMHRTVKEYVASCDVCQRAKSSSLAPAGLLQPLPISDRLWEDVSMDFVDGLPRSDGNTTIMVVVDRLSKSAHLVPLSHPYTAKKVAAKFMDAIVKLHGMPRSIVSDRDPVFVSLFWREFWKLAGTQLRMSSAYHPQSDS